MADTFDCETRSRIMAKVRSENTGIEEQFAAYLKASKIKYFKRQANDLPGKPDFVFRKAKVAVFIDGCFWHGCQKHLRMPASNQVYWQDKIAKNILRDRRNHSLLRRLGWSVIRVWEHEIRNPTAAIGRVKRSLEKRRPKTNRRAGIVKKDA